MATFEWSGYGALIARVGRLCNPDATSLMIQWRTVIEDDNRTGVLAGLDCFGMPMRAVTYRPKLATGVKAKKWSAKQEATHAGRRGIFEGMGPTAAGFDDNLSSSQYRKLGGPPLAPRGANSRVIKNLETGHSTAPDASGEWFAIGAWPDVVSKRGVPFLHAHFTGASTGRNHATKLPIRELRGIRPDGRAKAVVLARDWALALVKEAAA